MKSAREDSVNLYGLKPTSDRMAELLRGPGARWHNRCKKYIERKKAEIRQRKIELGMETGVTAIPHEGVRVIAERDIAAAARHMEE